MILRVEATARACARLTRRQRSAVHSSGVIAPNKPRTPSTVSPSREEACWLDVEDAGGELRIRRDKRARALIEGKEE